MECPHRQRRPNGKGCIHFLQGGFCKLPHHFRCEPYVAKYEFPLSHSLLQLYLRCRRAFWYHAIEGWERLPHTMPVRMRLGSMFAIATELLHGPEPWTWERLEEALEPYMEEYFPEPSESDLQELAKLRGLLRAYIDLGVPESLKGDTEVKFALMEEGVPMVYGTVDQLLWEGDRCLIVERKYTSNPSFYSQHFMSDQLAVYFLAFPTADRCLVQLVQHPGHRPTKNESLDDFEERVRQAVLASPRQYLPGFRKEDRVYGQYYYRSEFEEEIDLKRRQLQMVSWEIRHGLKIGKDWFYRNTEHCQSHPDFLCPYLPIKETGVVSPELFRQRPKQLFEHPSSRRKEVGQ